MEFFSTCKRCACEEGTKKMKRQNLITIQSIQISIVSYYLLLFSHHVVSDSLQLYGRQHARLPSPLSPGVCANSYPLSQWCYLPTSSSVALFSFYLQSFPASGTFPMNWLLASGGQNWSFSFNISVPNEYALLVPFRIDWSPFSTRDSQEASLAPQWCDHSPRARHPGMQSQVKHRKHHYEQS